MSGKKKESLHSAITACFSVMKDQSSLKEQLEELANDIAIGLSGLETVQSKELLGAFVSALFLAVAEEDRRKVRRQKQAEGIAAARARGVRFGPQPKPFPDNFDVCYKAWQDGEMTQAQAAEQCGISRKAFNRAVARVKQTENCAV